MPVTFALLDTLIRKGLFILIPFYIFNYENKFDKIESDENEYASFYHTYRKIRIYLNTLDENGTINAYEKLTIIDMTKRVIRALGSKHQKIQEAGETMGGKILDFEAKRIRDEERINTDREKARADEAEARADEAEARADEAEARADEAEARAERSEREIQRLREKIATLQRECI